METKKILSFPTVCSFMKAVFIATKSIFTLKLPVFTVFMLVVEFSFKFELRKLPLAKKAVPILFITFLVYASLSFKISFMARVSHRKAVYIFPL